MRFTLCCALLLASLASAADGLIPIRDEGFSRGQLMRSSSIQLGNPKGFSMQQSYSMQFTSSSLGSHSSAMYLNTLSYKLQAVAV